MTVVEAPVETAETPNSAQAPSSASRFAHRTVKVSHAVEMDVEALVEHATRGLFAPRVRASRHHARMEMHAISTKGQPSAWLQERWESTNLATDSRRTHVLLDCNAS